MIRDLDAATDTAIVADLFKRASDYVLLESGSPPDGSQAEDFFTEAPPGIDAATSQRFGFFSDDDCLVAIGQIAFGYPERRDAYLGLLLIDPDHRGQRLGQQMMDHVFAAARVRHASRVLMAVYAENTKAIRFWQKLGFTEDMRSEPTLIGRKTHIRLRMSRPL